MLEGKGSGFVNIASILLGLMSLAFAVHALQVKGCLICCTASLVSCGLALVFQLGELYRLTLIGDTAAVYDTLRGRLLAACVLLGLNVLLHLWALIRSRKQKCTTC